MKKQKPIQWLIGISAAACALCLLGLFWTLRDYIQGAPAATAISRPLGQTAAPVAAGGTPAPASTAPLPIPEEADGRLRIVALGDSLTRGTGDSAGKGYAGYAADNLEDRREGEVELVNYGVDGLTAPRLLTMLEQDNVKQDVLQADIIFVSIGGNDLYLGGQTLLNLNTERVAEQQKAFNGHLSALLTELRRLNGRAPIYALGLYNPFSTLNSAAVTNKAVREWNGGAEETASGFSGAVVVPTYDLFQLNLEELLHTDHFHPNAEGYKLIGERLASLIAAGEVRG
ncbi:MAG: Lysophospholipase L1-like esterase [Paenibacillaceae bacterium]|nr:Lysophospholipase L1-like esterase [Paenibacillaceae bacterium]